MKSARTTTVAWADLRISCITNFTASFDASELLISTACSLTDVCVRSQEKSSVLERRLTSPKCRKNVSGVVLSCYIAFRLQSS